MRVGLVVVGGLVLLVGAGSFMTGDTRWFWIGSGMVVGGLVLGGIALLLRPARQG